MRECGSCSLCCKLLSVDALNKPANTWCGGWEKDKGCTIYEDRPESCRTFECAWLQVPDMPENLKPNKVKCFIGGTTNGDTAIYVDPSFPFAYQEGAFGKFLAQHIDKLILDKKSLFIIIGDKRKAYIP